MYSPIYPSAARTSSQTTNKRGRPHGPLLPPQLTAVLDVTDVPEAGSVALIFEAFNPASGEFQPVFRCAPRSAVGKDVLHLADGLPNVKPTAAAGTLLHSASVPVAEYRLRVEHSGPGAFTYSLYVTD